MAAPKLTAEAVERFQRLFRGRENAHGEYRKHLGLDNRTAQGPATLAMFQNHLNGKGFVVGVVPITLENVVYWGAIDLDDDSTDHAALAAIVDHAGLPLVVCRSKSGGAHLYLFLKDGTSAGLVRDRLKAWAAALKLQNPEKDLPGGKRKREPVEVFPKSTAYSDQDLGNWINPPYYNAASTDRYAVSAEGDKYSLAEFLDVAEKSAINSFQLETFELPGASFQEGPPCLEQLDQLGYPEGSRNMGLLNVAIFHKATGTKDWEQRVLDYNETHFDPPLPEKEARAVVQSVAKRDYHYKCDELPIQPYCDKGDCKKRTYGIGVFKKQSPP